MCPRHLIKTIKRVKIVKWESIFKKVRFEKSISFKNAFHLTIFTRLMVFTICPGQITIVKWNFQHNDNLPFAWFSQHLGIVKWIFRNCVREETSSFQAQQCVQTSLWSYNTALESCFLDCVNMMSHDWSKSCECVSWLNGVATCTAQKSLWCEMRYSLNVFHIKKIKWKRPFNVCCLFFLDASGSRLTPATSPQLWKADHT